MKADGQVLPAPIRVSPVAPTTADIITLELGIDRCFAGSATLSTPARGEIVINIMPGVCSSNLLGPVTISIGPLSAGLYTVTAYFGDATPTLAGTNSFAVTAAPNGLSAPAYQVSDMWWLPSESGWGMSIVQHSNSKLFIVWYMYDTDGRATWLVVPAGTWVSPTRWVGTMYRTTGPPLFGPFDPSKVVLTMVGGVSIDFGSSDSAILEYAITGVSGSKRIQRQAF
jgi:hypothetical protein